MDIGRILARSLEIAWRYKFLWLLGFVMALTGGSGSNGFNFNNRSFTSPTAPPIGPSGQTLDQGVAVLILAVVACFLLIYLVLFFYFRFVARGAMVTAVRTVEAGGTPTLGSTWREGQGYYGRLLGLGFLVNLPLLIFALIILLVAFVPFIGAILGLIRSGSFNENTPPSDVAPFLSGLFGFIVLLCCAIACLVIVQLVIHPIYEFAVRAIVLENMGITEGLSRGYRRLRENLGNTILLYLVLIGVRIGWAIVVFIIALPIGLILAALLLAAANAGTAALVILVLIFGIPIGLLFAFIVGLFEVFESNVWTEDYLSLLASTQPTNAPVTPTEPQIPPASAVA